MKNLININNLRSLINEQFEKQFYKMEKKNKELEKLVYELKDELRSHVNGFS